ncbi:MAG: bifunctional lysylphosphatidylglycerol flippase/synthetase MprF [Candidatus Delongbacteria bacterium]|nr:bifunctional lysylphosphatidylglycerol flippase/synthetase MprF [Candidatus Delongbacteria bacterium]
MNQDQSEPRRATPGPLMAFMAILRSAGPPLLALLLFLLAAGVLHRTLQGLHYRDLHTALTRIPARALWLALLLTALNYLVLSGNDLLGTRWLGLRVRRWRVMLASLVAYSISNNVGFALLSGTSVRHRFFSRWGLGAGNLAWLVAFNSAGYWLGLLSLGSISLLFHSSLQLEEGLGQLSARLLGLLMLALVGAYLAVNATRREELVIGSFRVRLPGLPRALAQLALSSTDWLLAASVLAALLPAGGPPFTTVLGAFLAAQFLGVASNVPGGLGVFEGSLLALLGSQVPSESLLASLLLYRLVYYALPLATALLVLLSDELRQHRSRLAVLGRSLGQTSALLAPRVLAVFCFAAGLILLLSGATPAEHSRLLAMSRLLPEELLDLSHFLASILGVGLLLLAQAVSRRLRSAYFLAIALLAAGIVMSLLKAGDWEEAVLLGLMLAAFIPSRAFFDRRADIAETRFTRAWILAIGGALLSSLWLGAFAYRHVEYSDTLWWKVALDQDAPRFLRASVGAAVTLLGFASWRLLRPLKRVIRLPDDAELDRARAVIQTQSGTQGWLALVRDKALLFSPNQDAFVMYGVHGRTWAALGDPVGPLESAPALVRAFVEQVHDWGGRPVFYQVQGSRLSHYADLGMALVKLGDEARVPLEGFTLQGGRYRELRTVLNRCERLGIGFRVIPESEVAEALDALESVSSQWLTRKSASEKGFSLGCFSRDYLTRLPVAVLEQEGRILAFSNLLPGADHEEMSVDLMRFADDAPNGLMDALFAHLMLWSQARGYRVFNLGMAPLSGLEPSPFSKLWSPAGRFVYRHGDAFYNFEGLRAYKQKFHPEWEARYLAYPGGLALPLVLTDIAALSAGGLTRIFH